MIGSYHWVKIFARRHVDPTTGCWCWRGDICPSTGYGRIKFGDNRYHVHRISAIINLGLSEEDSKQFACHKPICSNRHCFNPDHLYVGDNRSNQKDVLGEVCRFGHDMSIYGARNGRKIKRYCKKCRTIRVNRERNRRKLSISSLMI